MSPQFEVCEISTKHITDWRYVCGVEECFFFCSLGLLWIEEVESRVSCVSTVENCSLENYSGKFWFCSLRGCFCWSWVLGFDGFWDWDICVGCLVSERNICQGPTLCRL